MAARAAAAAANGQSSNGSAVGANQPPFGSFADMIRRINSTADPSTPTGTTGGLMQGASAGMTAGMNPSTPTGTTGGLMQGVRAGNLMGGGDQATGATGGLMQGASAGMTAGVGVQDDFQSTTEERLTALEGDGQGQVAQANVNNLESGATSNFIPQNQQEVVKSVVDGNKPSDRGIQQMISKKRKHAIYNKTI